MIKISVLLAYRRIFRGKIFNLASLCMITVCTCLALAFLVTSALQCNVRNWGREHLAWSHRHHCVQAEVSWSGYAISDVITDLIILLIPVPLVLKLQLTLSKKISILLVFLLGSLSTAIGITRMVVILYFAFGMLLALLDESLTDYLGVTKGYHDFLGTISTALVWSLVEASVAVVASCLPSIRPLIHRTSDGLVKRKPSSSSQHLSKPRGSQLLVRPSLYDFDDIDDRQSLQPRVEGRYWLG